MRLIFLSLLVSLTEVTFLKLYSSRHSHSVIHSHRVCEVGPPYAETLGLKGTANRRLQPPQGSSGSSLPGLSGCYFLSKPYLSRRTVNECRLKSMCLLRIGL